MDDTQQTQRTSPLPTCPPLWRQPPTQRHLLSPPTASGPPPLTPPPAFGASGEAPRQRRPTRARAAALAALAVTFTVIALGAGAGLANDPGPGERLVIEQHPTPAPTPSSEAPRTRTDFTTIDDPCALPKAAALQHLSPDGVNHKWRTGDNKWSCLRLGRDMRLPSTPGDQGPDYQTRNVLISLAIKGGTAEAHKAFMLKRDRDQVGWSPRRQRAVQHVGDDAYSGYDKIGGTGKAHATVRLRNLVFTVNYTGYSWSSALLAPQTPIPEHTARAGAVMLAREVVQGLARCSECTR